MAGARAPWQLELETVKQRTGYLLTSGNWSDCTFAVGSEPNKAVVPAHKLVLAMASPVFEAMFYGALPERNNQKIPIPDIQPEAFKALLEYMYTGNTNIESFNMAWELWYGAKKYMLPHLLKECKRYIWSVVGPNNVCQTYEFAHFFDEKTLMKKCIQIISTNTQEVLNDSSFVDVDLNTILTVLSLNDLNVDNELDLFHAVARYAEEEQVQGQISPAMEGPPSRQLSKILEPATSEEKVSLLNVEGSSETSPAELDSKKITKEATLKPKQTADNLKKVSEVANIRAALEKLRFLTLTPDQFAEGPARSGLLTKTESFAVFMNIVSRVSDEPMPTGFSECRERRRGFSEVDEKPDAEPRFKPNTSPGGIAATRLTVPEIVQGLLWDVSEQAARAARRMTCDVADDDGSSENLTQLVPAIPLLVTALDQPWTGVQYDAAWALTNIATVKEHIMKLVESDAVPKLVGLLGRGGVVAAQAAWALGNIVTGGNLARDAVVNCGALPALLAHMQPDTTPEQLRTYLWTYRIICQSKTPFELVSPAFPYIEELLVLADEQVLVEACWVLFHLTTAPNENIDARLLAPELTTRLVALLGHTAPKVRIAALGATANMLAASELIDQIFEAGCLDHIINFLKCGKPSHVEGAARASVKIMSGTPLQIQQALDKRILDPLRLLLTEGNFMCQWHAAYALSTFSYCGTASQVSVLTAAAVLEPFCRLLTVPQYCNPVLLGLGNMMQKTDPNKLDALCLKLREIGVPKIIVTLRQYSDKRVRATATHLIETYFPEEKAQIHGNE